MERGEVVSAFRICRLSIAQELTISLTLLALGGLLASSGSLLEICASTALLGAGITVMLGIRNRGLHAGAALFGCLLLFVAVGLSWRDYRVEWRAFEHKTGIERQILSAPNNQGTTLGHNSEFQELSPSDRADVSRVIAGKYVPAFLNLSQSEQSSVIDDVASMRQPEPPSAFLDHVLRYAQLFLFALLLALPSTVAWRSLRQPS